MQSLIYLDNYNNTDENQVIYKITIY